MPQQILSIQMKNLKGVSNMMNRLPKNIQKEVGENAIMDLARNLQKRMKYRAPVGTGWLRRSIMVEKNGKQVKVVVYAHYAKAVEEGRNKNFVIPLAYFEQHQRMPDAPGQRVTNPKRWITLSGKAHPFVKPAFDSLVPKIPQLLTKYVEKAINKSRQGVK